MRTALRSAVAMAAASALYVLPAYAGDSSPPATSEARPAAADRKAPEHETQQERMKRCNATAKEKDLKGDERRAFMSSCLKG